MPALGGAFAPSLSRQALHSAQARRHAPGGFLWWPFLSLAGDFLNSPWLVERLPQPGRSNRRGHVSRAHGPACGFSVTGRDQRVEISR